MALPIVYVTHIRALANQVLMVDTVTVPDSLQEVISGDCDITTAIFVNYGGQAQPKISLTDGNGKEWVLTLTPVSSGFPVTVEFPEGLHASAGLSWICDTPSAVRGKVVFRR